MNPKDLSKEGAKLFRCIEFDDKEQLVAEIRKHPVGLVFLYLTGLIITGILFVSVMVFGALIGESGELSVARPLILFAGLILAILSLVSTFIAAYLYTHNVMLVTSDKISQMLYPSLFNRKISQLSIGDVQDVTVRQIGIIAHIFNYGTIVIETAGEQNNYSFTFTPNPYEASQKIVGAHEENLKSYGN